MSFSSVLLKLIGLLAIFLVERALGLPVLFIGLGYLFLSDRQSVVQILFVLIASVLIGIGYAVHFGVSLTIYGLGFFTYQEGQAALANRTIRLMIATVLSTFLLGSVLNMQWINWWWGYYLVLSTIVLGLYRAAFGRRLQKGRLRYSPRLEM